MLTNSRTRALIEDIATAMNEQFRYIPTAPVESQTAYEAAIKDCTVGIATVLHQHFTDFNVDWFYKESGYPGTHPNHKKIRN